MLAIRLKSIIDSGNDTEPETSPQIHEFVRVPITVAIIIGVIRDKTNIISFYPPRPNFTDYTTK